MSLSRRLRTFIAVDVDAAVRERAVALQQKLAASGAAVKWVEPDNLHLTLLFLGEVDQREVVDVCRAVTGQCRALPAFTARLATVGAFPNLRRPRTVWAGVTDGAEQLRTLHDALEGPLLEL